MLAIPTRHPLEHIPASFPSELRWYAFYSSIHGERRAGESIGVLGYQTFIPFEKRIQRHRKGKARPYEAALFPRYGFVLFDINDAGWGEIPNAKGVVDLIRCNAIPKAIPSSVIDSLKLADGMGVFDRTQPPKVGVEVEVSEGPFAGIVGKIIRARSGDRVDVLLKVLGGETIVNAPLATLREA